MKKNFEEFTNSLQGGSCLNKNDILHPNGLPNIGKIMDKLKSGVYSNAGGIDTKIIEGNLKKVTEMIENKEAPTAVLKQLFNGIPGISDTIASLSDEDLLNPEAAIKKIKENVQAGKTGYTGCKTCSTPDPKPKSVNDKEMLELTALLRMIDPTQQFITELEAIRLKPAKFVKNVKKLIKKLVKDREGFEATLEYLKVDDFSMQNLAELLIQDTKPSLKKLSEKLLNSSDMPEELKKPLKAVSKMIGSLDTLGSIENADEETVKKAFKPLGKEMKKLTAEARNKPENAGLLKELKKLKKNYLSNKIAKEAAMKKILDLQIQDLNPERAMICQSFLLEEIDGFMKKEEEDNKKGK